MRQPDPRAADAARTTQIHAKPARRRQLADDHFGHDPDAVHRGHVGDLGRVEQALDELLGRVMPSHGSAAHAGEPVGPAEARRLPSRPRAC